MTRTQLRSLVVRAFSWLGDSTQHASGVQIAPDGTLTRHASVGRKWALGELQKLVDGYIELVQLRGMSGAPLGVVMVVDEEGALCGPETLRGSHNELASALAGRPIVGTVVLVRESAVA